MELEEVKKIAAQVVRPFRMAWEFLLNPSYTGGNIRADENLTGTASTAESYSLFPFTYRYPQASSQGLMFPYGANSKVAAGRMESIHAGLPASGNYWFVPGMGEAATTFTGASAALRLTCPKPIFVTRATVEVTTNQGGSTATIKIFASNEGTTPLWTSNGIATTSNTFLSSTASTGAWLNPGFVYIVEYSNTNASVAVRAGTLPSSHLNTVQATRGTTAANIVAGTSTNADPFVRINLF